MRRALAENEKVLTGAPFAHLRFEQRPEAASALLYLFQPYERLTAPLALSAEPKRTGKARS